MREDVRFGRASLAQVAGLLGKTENQVLEAAIERLGDNAVRRGWLTAEAVTTLTADVPPKSPVGEAEALIVKAFQQAQESLKADWTSMAVPVLKNRLLQLTSKSFRESDYGSPSIWHFVTRFPTLLAPEDPPSGEQVRLLSPERVEADLREAPVGLDPAAKGRVRPDLWRAVFDYSSQVVFVWDEHTGRARPKSDLDPPEIPVLPTLSHDAMNKLRAEFVGLQTNVPAPDTIRLAEWVDRGGPTVALPRLYRGLWNAQLKSHAADALRAFFVAHNLEVPRDLVEREPSRVEPEREVERVRRLAHRYVDAMTGEELARLSIEVAIVLRVSVHTEV